MTTSSCVQTDVTNGTKDQGREDEDRATQISTTRAGEGDTGSGVPEYIEVHGVSIDQLRETSFGAGRWAEADSVGGTPQSGGGMSARGCEVGGQAGRLVRMRRDVAGLGMTLRRGRRGGQGLTPILITEGR